MRAAALPAGWRADPNRLRGEFVLVLHALAVRHERRATARTTDCCKVLLARLPLKQAVALAAKLTGAPRNALYERALALKGSSGDRAPPRRAAGGHA